MTARKTVQNNSKKQILVGKNLIHDLRSIIEQARQNISSTVNASLTLLYWHVGNRIHKEILQQNRAEYGKEIVVTTSRQCRNLPCKSYWNQSTPYQ